MRTCILGWKYSLAESEQRTKFPLGKVFRNVSASCSLHGSGPVLDALGRKIDPAALAALTSE